MKHPKQSPIPLLTYAFDEFDDRTLASLVGANVAHPDDEQADLLRSLERWGDKLVPTKLNGGRR